MNLEEEPDNDPRVAWMRRLIWLLLLLGMGACLSEGANSPSDPTVVEEGAGQAGRSPIEGFEEVAFRVQPAGDGIPSTTEFCALHAQTPEQRAQGWMHQDDLRGYDGMVFSFGGDDVSSGFHMENVRFPLTVAWLDAGGGWVGAADMAPCPGGGDCPGYPPPGPYRLALEVAQGDLDRIGLGPESRVDLGGPCPAANLRQ